ncbi:MlaE family ABC transporter permease [Larkinella arboricola]|uniref:Phospholipid/cholesterol/gamma-HCH transport system permease protein n=1 Tax=Larkinella arboricola TaxID=643671 RepID=A0A327XCN5_LARAB|nr:ABC transporter permease [Larkinella arboricola]RAK02036.1 phospholipid/cholesterol/gamma-HCH transport system permease protein [Larkinella arboricola]
MQASTTSSKSDSSAKPVVSRRFDRIFLALSDVASFMAQFFKEVFVPPYEGKEIIRQCYEVGVRSLPLISLTGFITGIVFTNQSRPSLATFGATSWLPSLISIALVRALAPLVTALIASGRVGSNIGAELGSMRVTEQIEAMEVSGTNPFKFLVVSRVVATTFMIPTLAMFFILLGMLGSYVNVHQNEATSFMTFIDQFFSSISFLDINSTVVKSIVFGFTIGMVGSYKGYHSSKGTEGVGRAANSSVVTSMFLVFIEELLALQIINAIRAV